MSNEEQNDKGQSGKSKIDDVESLGTAEAVEKPTSAVSPAAKEVGGRGGLDPTRYGDWEKAGRCIDF